MARRYKNRRKKEVDLSGFSLNLEPETKRDIAIITFLVLAIITFLAVFNLAGGLGAGLFNLLKVGFGMLAYIVPILLAIVAYFLFRDRHGDDEEGESSYFRIYLGILLFSGSFAGLLHILVLTEGQSAFEMALQGKGGGFLGAVFAGPLYGWLGLAGGIVLAALLCVGIIITMNISLFKLFPKKDSQKKPIINVGGEDMKVNELEEGGFIKDKVSMKAAKLDEEDEEDEEDDRVELKVPAQSMALGAPKLEALVSDDRTDWKLPPFDLLDLGSNKVDSGNIEANMHIIEKTLADFGIKVEMGEVSVGPTVTQYTFRPEAGVRLSQIGALQSNLALALAAHSLRMELPIPGKSLVGIEIPNVSTRIVHLREVLQTKAFTEHASPLAFTLGRDVAGKEIVADLSKMPHLLIAGASGKGKSVMINSLLTSLLYRNTPQRLKIIAIDPKRVELTLYNGIPHLATPVITDKDKALNALKWAVSEMERRYKLVEEAGKRDIIGYNQTTKLELPYIVIIIDEMADLMQVAKADMEGVVARLAQMARAVGIHLVLATQSPRVEVVTGLIKANITARIAFAVSSQIESRTILDSSGAEKLLGNGDMLFVSVEFSQPKRVQGAFIGEKEVRKVVDFFKAQAGAVIYNDAITEKPRSAISVPGLDGEVDAQGEDPEILRQAIVEVKQVGRASASLLQRRLRLGYARAARVLDILEQQGIVGPNEGAKGREVYGVVTPEEKSEYGAEESQE